MNDAVSNCLLSQFFSQQSVFVAEQFQRQLIVRHLEQRSDLIAQVIRRRRRHTGVRCSRRRRGRRRLIGGGGGVFVHQGSVFVRQSLSLINDAVKRVNEAIKRHRESSFWFHVMPRDVVLIVLAV